ncbi:glycosyl hydrolase family 28-related protein [Bacillus salipaludis]|uniref:Glycosyl hydrolase family 28-related protein n=1 Tax=Bacillus salipaludis TaxID=2547811 RepID=A0AA90QLV6_9BACI|nr:glycosyl hydrolase family 28-related protein [Bacillus salipaludis]MDQ6595915.1 glycosyl hydrolase family 28-related protein [Bacillus salipaludis]
MLTLGKNHDPRRNGEFLSQINGGQLDLKRVLHETEKLYLECTEKKIPLPAPVQRKQAFQEKILSGLFRPLSFVTELGAPSKIMMDAAGNVYPEWKEALDNEYNHLLSRLTREVNVADFGAIGDGRTDSTAAFKKAIGTGRVKVRVPEGIFITKGILLPSWTCIVGAGKGKTIIKLHRDAPKGTRLVTNTNHWRGNHHLFVQGMTLDWNVERLGHVPKTATWGNHSSCLTYANVTYGWVRDVEAINPGLHCFDISSTLYNYAGDGYRAKGGSSYIWLDNLNGYGFGDDGITTHHSEKVFISNSHMCDPSGRAHKKGFSNSNGIEIDDGSRDVMLVNNSTARCFGGVECKAHENSSAAANVQIIGHLSVNDNRSFNFRHIGHHKNTDNKSKTAYNLMATNLASIAPIYSDLYADSTPRGLVVSAYENVVINHFTLVGDPDYEYKGNPVIAIQYRARKVILNHISLCDFKKAGAGIKIYGGANQADSVRIENVVSKNSSSKAVEIGQGIQDVLVTNVKEYTDLAIKK